MNKLIELCIQNRNGHYLHCLEIENLYDLESTVESIISESREEFSLDTYIDFFETLAIYPLNEDNQDKIWSANIKELVTECYEGMI
tara:strand:- start:11143 stop:11400 length:258 start_codon:yes stop_codon:yes gene_type:complete